MLSLQKPFQMQSVARRFVIANILGNPRVDAPDGERG
jgi:hypothetical protein